MFHLKSVRLEIVKLLTFLTMVKATDHSSPCIMYNVCLVPWEYHEYVPEILRSFERSSPLNFRTQGSFIHIKQQKIFERDLLSSDSVAKSAIRKPWVF